MSSHPLPLEQICMHVTEICREAGKFIAAESKKFDASLQLQHKGLHDLVSYVDKETEKLLVTRLKTVWPEVGFIAEEGTESSISLDNPPTEGLYWIIDPLDGTTNFVHGLPIYAVSVGLWHNGQIVVACVYEVNFDECFYAWKDGGAYCNGKRIKVSDNDLDNSLLATGFPYYDFGRLDDYLAIMKQFMQKTRGLRRLGSAATDLAYVACGRNEGFFEFNLKPWDIAAGVLLVQEAGGLITGFEGEQDFLFKGNVVSGGKNAQPAMLDIIKKIWER